VVVHALRYATRSAKTQVVRVRGGMDMKNLVKVAMLVVAFASACCAQEAVVNVSSKGKQKWSPSEVNSEGVVILAFEDLLTPERRTMITNRALNLAQATVNIGEIGK
jgi:hypothetical protein